VQKYGLSIKNKNIRINLRNITLYNIFRVIYFFDFSTGNYNFAMKKNEKHKNITMMRHTEETETTQLQRLKQGDQKAFEVVYRKYGGRVYHFFLSLLHDKFAAEDLTQNVFLKIWERRAGIDPGGHFEAYLFTIARHIMARESEKRLQEECLKESLQTREDADTSMEQLVEAESLQAYIATLIEHFPPARKRVFLLSRVHHLTNREIAQKLSVSEKTVETHLYRALRFLKSRLNDRNG
jgi:RNA polymerase sigma-70 factor (ECF subfamily)